MDKQDILGTAQAAGGAYLGYQGIKHGLPRALGIRIEYHTTSKNNAKQIKKSGNILDPKFGGTGWSLHVNEDSCINNSKNYIHITGYKTDRFKNSPKFKFLAPFMRKFENLMYRATGNSNGLKFRDAVNSGNKKEFVKVFFGGLFKSIFNNKTKLFCIPGIDSYFDKNFIPDCDDEFALKTTNKLKVYNNRFSAAFAGLKKFGLKGIKENKGRFAAGLSILSVCGYTAYKLISAGFAKFSNN